VLWSLNDLLRFRFRSGSDVRKVLVPVTVPVPVPDSDFFSTVFHQQKICTNLAFSMPKAWRLIFYITSVLHNILDPVRETAGMHYHWYGSGSAKANLFY
jgi:hypothetical protein